MLTEGFYSLLTSFLKPEGGNSRSIYLAVGSGNPAWDTAPPFPPRGVQRLESETFRTLVDPAAIAYLDGEDRTSETPTTRLRFRVLLGAGDALGTLRECGLFAGEAGPDAGSGTLISYFHHPRIDKTGEMELERAIRLDLSPRPPPRGGPGEPMRYLGNSQNEEIHDLENETRRCRLASIRSDRRVFFPTVEAAQVLGYDFCGFCFPPGFSRR